MPPPRSLHSCSATPSLPSLRRSATSVLPDPSTRTNPAPSLSRSVFPCGFNASSLFPGPSPIRASPLGGLQATTVVIMMQVTQGSPTSLGRSPTFDPSPSAVVGGPDIIPSTTTTTTTSHHIAAATPSAVKSEESSTLAEGGDPLSKPKQKRNKPTLSCLECVERKTKCDRVRPCLACVKRQSACEYTAVCLRSLFANVFASDHSHRWQTS